MRHPFVAVAVCWGGALVALVALFWSSGAFAQTGICAQGRECTVNSLTTTSVPRNQSGLSSNQTVKLGSYSVSGAAIWFQQTTPGTTNYALFGSSASTNLNAPSGTVALQSGGSTRVTVDGTKVATTGAIYIQIPGVANASLPTCNAGAAGSIHYDTSGNCISYCNGTSWACVLRSSTASNGTLASFGGYCITGGGTGGCENDSGSTNPFLGGYASTGRAGTVKAITCSYGTKTATSGTIVAHVIDNSGGTEVCNCSLGACTTAINTPLSCTCAGTMAADHTYGVAFKTTTSCDANPNNIFCNVTFAE